MEERENNTSSFYVIAPLHGYRFYNKFVSERFIDLNKTDNETDNNDPEVYDKDKKVFLYTLTFICLTLFFAVISREYMKKYHFPYTVLMLLFGAALGAVDYEFKTFPELMHITQLHVIIHLLLPVIIYNCAFGLNPHMFMMAACQCVILALAGLVICATLNAIFAKVILTTYNWNWITCFLFGTILCASDPSSMIGLFKDYGVSPSLTTIIEGESLLNSGIAMALSKCLMDAPGNYNFHHIFWDFVVACLGAVAFGYVVAAGTVMLLRRTEGDTDMEVTFTLCIAYIAYFTSEVFLGISGILTSVVLGLTVANYKSSVSYEEEETTVHQFWQTLSFWANSFIFTIVGLIIATDAIKHMESIDIGLIIATYFMASVFRGFMIVVLSPLIKKMGYELSWKYGAVLTWGGMRGAIGLALGLMSQYGRTENPEEKFLIQVYGVIVLTLIFNASTLHWLLKILGMRQITSENIESMAHAVDLLRDAARTTERATQMDKYLSGVDWDWVHKVTQIRNPYEKEGSGESAVSKWSFHSFRGRCKECSAQIQIEPNAEEFRRMESDSRQLIMRALKTSIVNQHTEYGILRRTLGHLSFYIDHIMETSEKYLLAKDVKRRFLCINKYVKFLKRHLGEIMRRVKKKHHLAEKRMRQESAGSSAFRQQCIRIFLDRRFGNGLYWALLLNVVPVAGEFSILFKHDGRTEGMRREVLFYELLNVKFTLYYIWDAVVTIGACTCKTYFMSTRKVVDFIVTLVAVAQAFYGILFATLYWNIFGNECLYILVAMSAVRLIRLFKVTCSGITANLLNQCCSAFYNAYDLAIGFIVANSYVEKNAHKILDYEECADFARSTADSNVYEMLCYIDEMAEDHPGVVCAWRTHRAALFILRNMKELIEDMVARYMIDENDAEQLLEEIDSNMKDALTASRHMRSIPGVRPYLENVQWILNDEIVDQILENHKIENFGKGEVIQECGRMHSDLKILYRGIIQIRGTNNGEKNEMLPNADTSWYFKEVGNFSFHTNSPHTIGLLGYLLQTPSVTTTIASKNTQMITIDFDIISELEKQFDDLNFRMWRPPALQIALSVLSEEQAYENWSEGMLKIHLEEGIFPNLDDTKEFDVHPTIDDIVLVQGRVKAKKTDTEFVGPAYIPNSVRSLVIEGDPSDRPRVIMVMLRDGKYHDFSILNWVSMDDIKYRGLCIVHGIKKVTSNTEIETVNPLRPQTSLLNSFRKFWKTSTENLMDSSS